MIGDDGEALGSELLAESPNVPVRSELGRSIWSEGTRDADDDIETERGEGGGGVEDAFALALADKGQEGVGDEHRSDLRRTWKKQG